MRYTVAPVLVQKHKRIHNWHPWLIVVEHMENLEVWEVVPPGALEIEAADPLAAALSYVRAGKDEFAHVVVNTDVIQGEYVLIPVDGRVAIYDLSKADNWDYWETKQDGTR